MTRLRITVASDEDAAEEHVRLGGVSACSDTACYQADTPAFLDLANTEAGAGTPVVDMAVPFVTINSIHFVTASGPKSMDGQIVLREPLRLENHGGEVLVVLKRNQADPVVTYTPVNTSTGIWGFIAYTAYYNPKFATAVSLPMGTSLSIPRGATDQPQIFRLNVQDAGKPFPDVDMYPKVVLSRPIDLQVTEVVRPWFLPEFKGRVPIWYRPLRSPHVRSFTQTGTPAKFRRKVFHTEPQVFDPDGREDPETGAAAAPTSSLAPCAASLRSFAAQRALPADINYIPDCKDVAPYVHIAIADLRNSKRLMFIPTSTSSYIEDKPALNLLRLTDFSSLSYVSINYDQRRTGLFGLPSARGEQCHPVGRRRQCRHRRRPSFAEPA